MTRIGGAHLADGLTQSTGSSGSGPGTGSGVPTNPPGVGKNSTLSSGSPDGDSRATPSGLELAVVALL